MDLFQRRLDTELESYLSGLLIGEELRAELALRVADAGSFTAVAVIGSDALTTRYQRALAGLGVAAQVLGADATWRGWMALAAHTAQSANEP